MVTATSLEQFELFRLLGRPAREALAARALLRKYRAGQYLWRAGDESRGLHLVLAGRVRIVRDEGRWQHVVHVEGAGASLGEVPLFAGGGYPASALAAEATTCIVIERSSLQAVMATHPNLAWSLLASLAARLRDLVERLSSRTGDPIQTRLAAYILSQPRSTSGALLLRETQQAIAEELGTVREIVGRQLAALVQARVLERRARGRYAVVDEAGLAAMARRAHL